MIGMVSVEICPGGYVGGLNSGVKMVIVYYR